MNIYSYNASTVDIFMIPRFNPRSCNEDTNYNYIYINVVNIIFAF